MMKSSASQRRRRLRFIYLVRSYPGGYVTAYTASTLGATSTSPGQQLTRHVVARGLGHVSPDPSPSLRPKRQGNAPLTSRHHQPSPARHQTPSTSRMRPKVFRYSFFTADFADHLATVASMGRALRFTVVFISRPAARATPRHDCPRAPACAPACTARARMGPPKRYRFSRSPRPSCGGRGGGQYRVRLPPHMI